MTCDLCLKVGSVILSSGVSCTAAAAGSVPSDADFFLTYRNAYYREKEKLFVGSMPDHATDGIHSATSAHFRHFSHLSTLPHTSASSISYLAEAIAAADPTRVFVFTSKLFRTQMIADWYSQALSEELYKPRELVAPSGVVRSSINVCQPGEEMTALEKHCLFFCGSPEEAPHISTATLSFENMIERIKLLRVCLCATYACAIACTHARIFVRIRARARVRMAAGV